MSTRARVPANFPRMKYRAAGRHYRRRLGRKPRVTITVDLRGFAEAMQKFAETVAALAPTTATDPTCRECAETKHGACDGTALVDTGDEIETHNCGCAEAGHPSIPKEPR